MNGKELLEKAIERVESKSIREWASSEHNKPLLIKIADRWLEKGHTDVVRFSTYIVCLAMGF